MSSPINAQAVPPGFPQATRRVYIVSIGAVEQERVDAVESVGSVQQPPAAGWMRVIVVVLAPMLIFHARGGVAAGLLHAATVLLNSVRRRRGVLLSEIVLVQLVLAVAKKPAGLLCDAQTVDLQRRAGGRGALSLRVQGGGGRRQRALPPGTSPLSTAAAAAAVSLRQFHKHNRRRRRRRSHISTVLAV